MINIFIIIGGCLLLVGLLYQEKKKNQKALLITKTILSLLFVLTAWLQAHWIPAYYHYLLVGLVFCLIGDICLALPGAKTFQAGLMAFLIGHIFYVFSFSVLIKIWQWISPGAFILLGVSAFVFFWLRPYLKHMLVPVFVYILVITIMVWGAGAVFWRSTLPFIGRAFILGGAFCFYFSDIFVARDKFLKEEFRNRLIGLPLYYAAQFLLAFSTGLLG